jgi:hypothetical protein
MFSYKVRSGFSSIFLDYESKVLNATMNDRSYDLIRIQYLRIWNPGIVSLFKKKSVPIMALYVTSRLEGRRYLVPVCSSFNVLFLSSGSFYLPLVKVESDVPGALN